MRGLGLIGAIELAADPARRKPFDPARGVGAYLVQRAQAHGLIVRVMAGDIIAFSPPLVITEAQIDEMLDKFDRALRDTEAWVRQRLTQATRTMAFIEFVDVCKHYPGNAKPAVDAAQPADRARRVPDPARPSGSGKTTCLMMLAGFESVSSGTIRQGGQPIEQRPAHQRNMGIVFQSYSLFPHMTVAGNVAFPLQVRKVGAARPRDARAPRTRSRAPGRFRPAPAATSSRAASSSASRWRVRWCSSRSLVLMDEPLAALDKRLREEMQLEIRRLHRDLGVTMVFVTHDQGEAMTLSDRVAVFNQGRIEQLDTPQVLYDAPANPFVAGFLGDNNRIVGRFAGRDAATGEALVEPPGSGLRCARAAAPRWPRRRRGRRRDAVRAPRARAPDRRNDARDGMPATVTDLIHQGDHWRLLARPLMPDAAREADAAQWLVKLSPSALPQGWRGASRSAWAFARTKHGRFEDAFHNWRKQCKRSN